jgi:hypothetical protein
VVKDEASVTIRLWNHKHKNYFSHYLKMPFCFICGVHTCGGFINPDDHLGAAWTLCIRMGCWVLGSLPSLSSLDINVCSERLHSYTAIGPASFTQTCTEHINIQL